MQNLKFSDFKETTTVAEVHAYLLAQGFDLNKRSFFRHAKQGKIRRGESGTFTRLLTLEYCRNWIKPESWPSSASNADDGEDWLARKIRADALKCEAHAARAAYELEVLQEKFITRDEMEEGLAARIIALEAGFDHMIYTKAPELVALVGGDQKNVHLLIAALMDAKDELLNAYADIEVFDVELT